MATPEPRLMPNNTTARVIRPVLRKAGLEGRIEQITTGRNYTYVRLAWGIDGDLAATMDAVLAALRPLWSDGVDRVKPVYNGMVSIKRAGWYRTEPAAPSNDLARLLRIVADGREEYVLKGMPDDQRDVLLAEAGAFRSAALLAEGHTENLWRLLPTWRLTPEVEALARRVSADAPA